MRNPGAVSFSFNLLLVALVSGCTTSSPAASATQPMTAPATAKVDAAMIKRLDLVTKDEANDVTGTHFKSFRRKLHAPRYAAVSILMEGRLSADSIARLLTEPRRLNRQQTGTALKLLIEANDPRVFNLLVACVDRKQIGELDAVVTMSHRLPFNELKPPGPKADQDKARVEWLRQRSEAGTTAILLDFFDLAFRDIPADAPRTHLLRYLNRIRDYDIDEWLAIVSPECRELRQRYLARGVDIMGEVLQYANVADSMKELDHFFAASGLTEADRRAFAQVIKAREHFIFGAPQEWKALQTMPPTFELWKWYQRNRDKLQYDFGLQRLVVKPAV